jgi:AraC family transcriptional regulator
MFTAGGGSRAEYLARIHAVQDYVERRLDEALRLETLARVARFSPFHFHRIYRALTGESLYQFILRLRLERAASRLLSEPWAPVTTIALDCGFSSPAAFARAFKAMYGASASAWRASSKIREANRKNRKAPAPGLSDVECERSMHLLDTPSPLKPADSVRVETVAPFPVAYIRHTGPYAGDAALFGRLFAQLMQWAGPRGLLDRPETRLLSVYHDNPEITGQQNLRLSVGVAVPPGASGSGEVNIMEIAAGEYAKASFELDDSEYGAAWNWVYSVWLPASGYQPDDGPTLECYPGRPGERPAPKRRVEIWVPVKPL